MTEKSLQNGFFDTEHLKADLKKRSVRGGAFTLTAQITNFFLYTGSTIILARLLTPQDFGLIAMVTAITGFVGMFKDLGLSMATIQKTEINHEQISTLFWINVMLSLGIMLITAALAPAIAWFYKEPRLLWITLALTSAFILGGLTVQHQALLRRQMRFGTLSLIQIISMLVGIVTAIILALYGADYWALVLMQLATIVTNTIAVWLVCDWRPGPPVRHCGIRSMLAFGGNLTGFNFFNYFFSEIDRVLIGRYIGAGAVGLYDKAYNLLLWPLRQVNAPASAVSIPALSRIVDEPHRYKKAYFKILNYITMLAVPGISFLLATSDWVIRLVLGPQWDEAARIFAILGFGGLLISVFNPTGWIYVTQGRTRDMLYWGFIDGGVKILSIIIGLHWGVTGVAVTVAIRYYVMAPFCLWFCCRKGPIRSRDFLPTLFYAGILSTSVLTTVTIFRRLSHISDPIAGIIPAFGIAVAVTLAIFWIIPEGRSTLKVIANSVSNKSKGFINARISGIYNKVNQ